MLGRLRKFPAPPQDERVNDFSVLSPAEQDRIWELAAKIDDSCGISDKEFTELHNLVESTPLIGPKDPQGGPDLEIPPGLKKYWSFHKGAANWRHYDFQSKLLAVQKVRFAELCRQHGWQDGKSPRITMQPIDTWSDNDYNEMTALLDAASCKK